MKYFFKIINLKKPNVFLFLLNLNQKKIEINFKWI